MALLWNLTFALALAWILYRVVAIYLKPLGELVDVLGLDIPPIPDVSLAGITPDSALLYWKPPENYHTALRHFIQVNGINVGEFNRSDASVQVAGLKPGCYYSIRAVATNASNFSSFGPLIRLRTVPLGGHEQTNPTSPLIMKDSEPTTTRTFNPQDDNPPNPQSPPSSHIHGHVLFQPQARRTFSGRRVPSMVERTEISRDHALSVSSDFDTGDTIPSLTRKLDELRRQQEDMDGQIIEEENSAEEAKSSLIQERDGLKQTLKEKEDAQLEVKKQVNELEKHSKAAQRKKSAKERLLQQKHAERQKMREDVSRWETEVDQLQKEICKINEESIVLASAREVKISEMQQVMDQCQAANKAMEEEIRTRGNQIKALEKERKRSGSLEQDRGGALEQLEREKDQAHETRLNDFHAQYSTLWQKHQMAEAMNQEAQDRLTFWLGKRSNNPGQFAPIPTLNYASSISGAQRRIRQRTSRTNTISLASPAFPVAHVPLNSIANISPGPSSATPFFNYNNGTTIPSGSEHLGVSQADMEFLTAGAPMSPTANTLLPSNLLRDDDPSFSRPRMAPDDASDTARLSNQYNREINSLHDVGPQSPGSEISRSPSLLSSPRDGPYNSHGYQASTDMQIDGEQRPVQSMANSYASSLGHESGQFAPRKLGGLFNFNRQRGKTSQAEPPPLGTLKQGQSQSFPRNIDQGAFDVVGSGRRRISSGTWTNPVASLLTRGNTNPEGFDEEEAAPLRSGHGRRSRLNVFGSKLEPLGPSMTPDKFRNSRPSSIYSSEHGLPRPSTDSQPFGWSTPNNFHQHSSPLGLDWASLSGPWSSANSRRPSVQHGSSSNLSLGSTPLDPEDYQNVLNSKGITPAPIGTERFTLGHRPITPKLNPTAPSFTTRFFSRNDGRKAVKGEKSSEKMEKGKIKDNERQKESEGESPWEESSPQSSRVSKDAHSILTSTSMGESHDSLEQSYSGTPSDMVATSTPRETLMQRLTRKGSSGKFNIPWAKDRSGLFSRKAGEPSTPGDTEEDNPAELQLGRSIDSISTTPQHEKGNRGSISWSNIIRKGRRGDKAASESSEKASETETGEDE